MSIDIRLKHSATANKAPQPADLKDGELALNTNAASPAAYIKDSAGNIVKLAGAGSVSTPDASETVKGIAELATQAEVDTGTDDQRIVTPLKLATAVPAASETAAGKVELATAAETTTGTDNTRAVHPAGLKVELDKKVDLAGDTMTGVLTLSGGYNILKGFNRRPPVHRGSLFYKTAAATISIVANSALNGFFYDTATAVAMPSHSNNTDYAIWQHPTTGALVADASFTSAPAGATGGSIVGGYHYIPSGRPTAVNNGSPTASAEILEYSIWDLTWRPTCPDPRGMACIEGGFWMDLYLCGSTSYAGSTFSVVPSSRIGLTIADGTSPPLVPAQYGGNGSTAYPDGKWYVFTEVARSFGKRLPTYDEFSAAAFGAPEQTSRGTDPGTVQWERVSKFGLAQATGVLWQWGQETCSAGPGTAWTTGTETDGRGQVYGPETRAVILGGLWYYTSYSGSRCALWNATPWNSDSNVGARCAAGHLVLG
jgi:hypothetical protein